MAQYFRYPIKAFAAPSANTEYVVATLAAQSNVPFTVVEVCLCPEGVVSTDPPFRYSAGVASGAGTPGTGITAVQEDPTKSLPSSFVPTGTQWGSGTPPTLASAQDMAAVPSSLPLLRNYLATPLVVKEGTTFALTANILGSANGNVKFSGYIRIYV